MLNERPKYLRQNGYMYVCMLQQNLSFGVTVSFPSFTLFISIRKNISREQCDMLPKGPKYLRQNGYMYACDSDSFISLFYLIV
jgi:hypothetical protein